MKKQTKITAKELIELKHKYSMEEIETRRKAELEIENIKFDHQLQLTRIKSAEIKKTIDRKQDKRFMESYMK